MVAAGDLRVGPRLPVGHIQAGADLAVEGIHGAHVDVAGNVLQMAPIAQPRSSHRDVVGGALALRLDEDRQVGDVLTVPCREWSQQLESVAGRRHGDLHAAAVRRRCLERLFTGIEAVGRQLLARSDGEADLLAGIVGERVVGRVEVEATGNGQGHHRLGRGDEGMRGRIAVVALREVPVVAGDDGVRNAVLHVLAVPLANAGPAGVGQHLGAECLEVGQ